MSVEERVRFLSRLAERAEMEGNVRAATLFRRMAREARPLEFDPLPSTLDPARGARTG